MNTGSFKDAIAKHEADLGQFREYWDMLEGVMEDSEMVSLKPLEQHIDKLEMELKCMNDINDFPHRRKY